MLTNRNECKTAENAAMTDSSTTKKAKRRLLPAASKRTAMITSTKSTPSVISFGRTPILKKAKDTSINKNAIKHR